MQVKDLDNNFSTEFKTFCSVLHENFLQNERMHEIMTSAKEQSLVDYLLTPQSSNNCNVDLSNWLQNYVFCVVTNEAQTTYELHIWMEDQKRVVSIENYFSTLCSLYAELDHITAESFIKKVNEMYALIPEEVASFFINRCLSNKESKLRTALNYRETKENVMYGCKVISYEYIKKKVVKKKVLTEIFNKSTGKVVQSKFQEEEPSEDFFYCVKKNERLLDITNNKQTEISLIDYASSHALQVKFLGQTVLAYFPPDEIQNHDHLVTLSGLIYKDREASTGKSGEIQMEFIVPNVPQESPEIAPLDLEDIFSRSTASESDHVYEKSPKKKNLKNRGNPNILMNLRGKLSLVTDPKTKCSTLKCIPIDNHDENHTQKLTLDLLKANAVQYTDSVDAIESLDVDTSISNDVEIGESGKLTEPSSDQVDKDNPIVKALSDDNSTGLNIQEVTLSDEVQTNSSSTICNQIEDKTKVCTEATKSLHISEQVQLVDQEINPSPKLIMPEHRDTNSSTSQLTVKRTETNSSKTLITVETGCDDVTIRDEKDTPQEIDNASKEEFHLRRSVRLRKRKRKYRKRKSTAAPPVNSSLSARKNKSSKDNVKLSDTDRPFLQCKLCPKKFRSKSGYAYHVESHLDSERFLCQHCGTGFSNKPCLRQHVRLLHLKLGKKSFPCKLCSRVFTSPNGRYYHIDAVHRKSEIVCELCGIKYTNRRGYLRHKASVHDKTLTKQKFHQCDICHRSFRSRSSVSYHKTVEHSKKDVLICGTCGARLKSELTLKVHMKIHEDQSLKECHLCDKKYTTKIALKAHLNIHNGILPYPCLHCERSFPSARHRLQHSEKIHSPKQYSCEICQKLFKSQRTFNYHILIHTGEKPYKCPDCNKYFRCLESVHIHKKIHSGKRTHVCEFCGQDFIQKGNMTRHIKKHHHTPVTTTTDCTSLVIQATIKKEVFTDYDASQ